MEANGYGAMIPAYIGDLLVVAAGPVVLSALLLLFFRRRRQRGGELVLRLRLHPAWRLLPALLLAVCLISGLLLFPTAAQLEHPRYQGAEPLYSIFLVSGFSFFTALLIWCVQSSTCLCRRGVMLHSCTLLPWERITAYRRESPSRLRLFTDVNNDDYLLCHHPGQQQEIDALLARYSRPAAAAE